MRSLDPRQPDPIVLGSFLSLLRHVQGEYADSAATVHHILLFEELHPKALAKDQWVYRTFPAELKSEQIQKLYLSLAVALGRINFRFQFGK